MATIERQPNGPSGPDRPGEEILDPRIEQIRFGNPEHDAPALVRLFKQDSTVGHLMGIDRDKFSEEDILRQYELRPDSSEPRIIVAVNPFQEVIGTITVPRPSAGYLVGEVQRLAVDERVRHKGVAKRLLRSAHSYIFSSIEDGGLDRLQSRAAIIRDVDGFDKAFLTFYDAHYSTMSDPAGLSCLSWSLRDGSFVRRGAQWMVLNRSTHKQYNRDLSRDFPAPFIPPTQKAA